MPRTGSLKPPQLESKLRKFDGNNADDGLASPEEGAELIRAFLNIQQRDVRAAVMKLVKSFSEFATQTQYRFTIPVFFYCLYVLVDGLFSLFFTLSIAIFKK